MKSALAFTVLASLAVAAPAPAQQAESLNLQKRLDGPVTVPLTHGSVRGIGALEKSKLHLAAKYPQFFDEGALYDLQKRADGLA